MTSNPVVKRIRLFTRTWRRSWRAGVDPSTVMGEQTLHDKLTERLTAPTQGNVFPLHAAVTLTWGAIGFDVEELQEAADGLRGKVRSEVQHRLTRLAREHQPHQGYDVERRLNQELERVVFAYTWGRSDVTCRAATRVAIDQRVRATLEADVLERITQDYRNETGLRHAAQVDQRTRRWSQLLERLQDDPLFRHAAVLTEAEFGATVDRMVSERTKDLSQLHGLLKEAIGDFSRVGLGGYEWAESYERTLRMMIEQNKIPNGSA